VGTSNTYKIIVGVALTPSPYLARKSPSLASNIVIAVSFLIKKKGAKNNKLYRALFRGGVMPESFKGGVMHGQAQTRKAGVSDTRNKIIVGATFIMSPYLARRVMSPRPTSGNTL